VKPQPRLMDGVPPAYGGQEISQVSGATGAITQQPWVTCIPGVRWDAGSAGEGLVCATGHVDQLDLVLRAALQNLSPHRAERGPYCRSLCAGVGGDRVSGLGAPLGNGMKRKGTRCLGVSPIGRWSGRRRRHR